MRRNHPSELEMDPVRNSVTTQCWGKIDTALVCLAGTVGQLTFAHRTALTSGRALPLATVTTSGHPSLS